MIALPFRFMDPAVTPSEVVSLSISGLSLLVAGVAAYRTYVLGRFQLSLATRHDFQKLLLELNKELIRDPELWGVYDSHRMAAVRRDDPAHVTKLEAYVYMKLNILQIVHAYMRDRGMLSRGEADLFSSWVGTCRDFVNDSCIVRGILGRKDTAEVYDAPFLTFLNELIEKDKKCLSSSPAVPATPTLPPA